MHNLNLDPTEFTPGISFDISKKHFSIYGISRPEDVRGFYQPLLDWLKEFQAENLSGSDGKYAFNTLNLDVALTYFNSSSAKYIMEILLYLKRFSAEGIKVVVNWRYNEDDDQMREDGEDLAEAVELDFQYIPVQ